MYARLITVQVQPERMEAFPAAFHERVLGGILRETGFKGIYLLQAKAAHKVTAMVLWETEADAQASLAGLLQQRLPLLTDLLAGPPAGETLEVILRA